MENMTNGELKATEHRVIDLGQDRYSAPMFVEPNFDDQQYAKNLRTGQIWTGDDPVKPYGCVKVSTAVLI